MHLSLLILLNLCLHFIRMFFFFIWNALLSVILIDLMSYLQTRQSLKNKIEWCLYSLGTFKTRFLFQFVFLFYTLYFSANQVFCIFYMSWASFCLNLPWLNPLTKYEIVGKAARKESIVISSSACLLWFDFFFQIYKQ